MGSNINLLYNPFIKIAGGKSLLLGLIGIVFSSVISFVSGTHLKGFSIIEYAKDTDFIYYFGEHTIHWILIGLCFYICALILSKSKTRAIDIFGTASLALIPIGILPLTRLLPFFKSFLTQSWELHVLTSIYWVSLFWVIILLFNGYKISSNLKNEKLIVSFAISLLLAEKTTLLILNFLNF